MQLRKLQQEVARESDETSLLDDEISKYKMSIMQDKQSSQGLDEETREFEAQV